MDQEYSLKHIQMTDRKEVVKTGEVNKDKALFKFEFIS